MEPQHSNNSSQRKDTGRGITNPDALSERCKSTRTPLYCWRWLENEPEEAGAVGGWFIYLFIASRSEWNNSVEKCWQSMRRRQRLSISNANDHSSLRNSALTSARIWDRPHRGLQIRSWTELNWFYWEHLQPRGAEMLNKLYNNTIIQTIKKTKIARQKRS